MKTSNSDKSVRSIFKKIGKLALAIGFAGALAAIPAGYAFAAHHGGGYHGGGHYAGHGGGYHGGGHWHGGWGGGYYAPGPDYYAAPEPYYYGPAPCYGPYYDEECGPPAPGGFGLFFGL